jgi:hypothetical protein
MAVSLIIKAKFGPNRKLWDITKKKVTMND